MKKLILVALLIASCGPNKSDQPQILNCVPSKDIVMGACNDPTKAFYQDNCSAELWSIKNNNLDNFEPFKQYRGFCR